MLYILKIIIYYNLISIIVNIKYSLNLAFTCPNYFFIKTLTNLQNPIFYLMNC